MPVRADRRAARSKRKKLYLAEQTERPDWRITCFFVDSTRRRQGVADAALAGALQEISRHGGGTVENYPEETAGRKVSASFLHNGTLSMFERHRFARKIKIGKHHWVVTTVVN